MPSLLVAMRGRGQQLEKNVPFSYIVLVSVNQGVKCVRMRPVIASTG